MEQDASPGLLEFSPYVLVIICCYHEHNIFNILRVSQILQFILAAFMRGKQQQNMRKEEYICHIVRE